VLVVVLQTVDLVDRGLMIRETPEEGKEGEEEVSFKVISDSTLSYSQVQ
jgi:hypothetical protein